MRQQPKDYEMNSVEEVNRAATDLARALILIIAFLAGLGLGYMMGG